MREDEHLPRYVERASKTRGVSVRGDCSFRNYSSLERTIYDWAGQAFRRAPHVKDSTTDQAFRPATQAALLRHCSTLQTTRLNLLC